MLYLQNLSYPSFDACLIFQIDKMQFMTTAIFLTLAHIAFLTAAQADCNTDGRVCTFHSDRCSGTCNFDNGICT